MGVCVCVCLECRHAVIKGRVFIFPLMLTRVSLDHLEGVINVTRAGMLSTSRRPRGGFMLEDVVKTKVLIFCFFVFLKFFSLSAGRVRDSGFINMKQMVEYHPLISVTFPLCGRMMPCGHYRTTPITMVGWQVNHDGRRAGVC